MSGPSDGFSRHQVAVEAFLAASAADLVRLVETAYTAVGGHYAALVADARAAQAASDAREFAAALRSGQIDQAALGRVVATAAGRARVADIVQMTQVLEARFNQWVALTLPAESALAAELRHRNQQVTVRFGLALATAARLHLTAPPDGEPPA